MINKNIFSLRKSSPWLLLGFACLIMVIFPHWVTWLSHLMSFKSPMNFLFFVSVAFLLFLQIINTYINTRRDNTSKELVQEISLLKSKLEEMEKEKNNTKS
jgi:hypothetical protein